MIPIYSRGSALRFCRDSLRARWLRGAAVVAVFGGLAAGCVEVPLGLGGPVGDGGSDGGTAGAAWRWESPLPQGNNLRSLWGIAGATADQDQLFAGGDNGTLISGGSSGWQLAQEGGDTRSAQPAILGLAGQGSGTALQALAVGVFDLALGRTSGPWTDLSPSLGGGYGTLNAVWAAPTAGEYYVVGTTGRMFHVLQGGASWSPEGVGATTDTLFGLAGTGSGAALDLYAVGDNGRIVHRAASGAWAVEADNLISAPLNSVWLGDGTAAGEVFAVGNGGMAVHKQGGTWKVESTGTATNLTAVWGTGSNVYAVGAGGVILHRQGTTWQREGQGLTSELLSSLWGTVRNGQITLYAAGNVGTLLRLDHGTWQTLSSRVTTNSLNAVWARSSSEIYAVGTSGVILRRSGPTAQGSWMPVGSGVTTESLNAVTGWSASATTGEAEVWAVGTAGAIVHKSGTTWSSEAGYLTNQELTGVWAGPDSVYVVGLGGRIYHKTQGSWNIETGPMGKQVTNDLLAVWGSGSGTSEVVYVVGSQGLVLRHDSHGWTTEAAGLTSDSITALFGDSENNLVALVKSGVSLQRQAGQWQTVPLLGASYVAIAGCLIPGSRDQLIVAEQGAIARQISSDLFLLDPIPTLLPYSGVAAPALNDYYIVGSSGMILHKY